MVWKNEMCGLINTPPGNDPVSMSFDCLCRLSSPKMKFEVTNVFNRPVVHDCRVHPGEDNIKVNCLSCKDIVPFRIRELGDTFGSKDHALGGFDIKGMIFLHEFAGELLIWGEDCSVCFIVHQPGKK